MMTKEKKKIWSSRFRVWYPPVLWGSVIFLFSSLTTNPVSEIYWREFAIKKSAHIVEYGIFATLLYRAFRLSGVSKKRAGIYSVVFSIFYGLTDEYHQSFTPGREPRIRDVVFDTIGALLAINIIWKVLPNLPPRLKNWAKSLRLI